jgi:hypothetical protein
MSACRSAQLKRVCVNPLFVVTEKLGSIISLNAIPFCLFDWNTIEFTEFAFKPIGRTFQFTPPFEVR